jgi:hypothetical protein
MTTLFIQSFLIGFTLYYFIATGYFGVTIQNFVLNSSKDYSNSRTKLIILFFLIFYVFTFIYLLIMHSDLTIYQNNMEILTQYLGDNEAGGASDKNSVTPAINPTIENKVSDNNININNPNLELNIPQSALDAFKTAASTGLGLGAGVRLAKQMPTPAGKLLAVAGTSILAHTLNITATKLSSNNSSDIGDSNKNSFVSELFSNIKPNDLYTEYPLNLLPDLLTYSTLELLFLTLMFNSSIAILVKAYNINFNSYLPNNKFGNFINYYLTRYFQL